MALLAWPYTLDNCWPNACSVDSYFPQFPLIHMHAQLIRACMCSQLGSGMGLCQTPLSYLPWEQKDSATARSFSSPNICHRGRIWWPYAVDGRPVQPKWASLANIYLMCMITPIHLTLCCPFCWPIHYSRDIPMVGYDWLLLWVHSVPQGF